MEIKSVPTIQLTIIGCGTLGCAIVDGLTNLSKPTRSYRLCLTGRRDDHAALLGKRYPQAIISTDNCDARIWTPMKTSTAHLVVIGTQPQFTKAMCAEIRDAIERFKASQRPVILTVCPGITTAQLESWLPAETPIIRSMPNTPVAVRQGATAVFMNDFVNPESMEEIKLVLSSVSPCIENLSREDLLDVAASVSGSAPAYLFYLMRAMVEAGVAKGLSEQQARSLVTQSGIGAGILAQSLPHSFSKLLSDVCVSGGSTEKAMATLESHRASHAILEAVDVSWRANVEMGDC